MTFEVITEGLERNRAIESLTIHPNRRSVAVVVVPPTARVRSAVLLTALEEPQHKPTCLHWRSW